MDTKKLLIFLSIFIFLFFSYFTATTKANISACSVSVSPSAIDGGATSQLVFHVTNNDDEGKLLYWVGITAPSSSFTITSAEGPNSGGSTVASDGSSATVSTSLSSGEGGDFNLNVTAANVSVTNASFVVSVSDSSDGSNAAICTGDSAVSINPDIDAILNISNVAVSASDTSATVSWNSSGVAGGYVDYGSTNSYGSQSSNASSGTSHSVTLSNLSASTTYHFRVTSNDSDGHSLQSSDGTFTTAAAGATVSTTVTVTTTNISTVTKEVIVEVKDTIIPQVKLTSDLTKPFSHAPEILGTATDDGGIAYIYYSIDRGRNWYNVDVTGKTGNKKIDFDFTPNIVDDGNYPIIVKTIDSSGNENKTEEQDLVIDRLVPQPGGVLFSVGPIILEPNTDGVITTISGLNLTVTLSAVGGPTSVKIKANDESYDLNKNLDNGLWSGIVNFPKEGEYQLSAELVDGANNQTSKDLHKIKVENTGKIFSNDKFQQATLNVFVYDGSINKFILWNGDPFNEDNPQTVKNDGHYGLYLPPGKYYLDIDSQGYRRIQTNIFEISRPTPITKSFNLVKEFGLTGKILGIFGIKNIDEVKIEIANGVDSSHKSELIGDEMPYFDLTSKYLGKPTVFTFLSTWIPKSVEQIEELEKARKDLPEVNFVTIAVQETFAKYDIFLKRGNYSLPFISDPDGKFIEPLMIESLPLTVFSDRKGVINGVFGGVINRDIVKQKLIY